MSINLNIAKLIHPILKKYFKTNMSKLIIYGHTNKHELGSNVQIASIQACANRVISWFMITYTYIPPNWRY